MITISSPESYNAFLLFYQIAFITPFLILLIHGIIRKYNMTSWLTIMMAASFFFLIGTRISTFSLQDWSELIKGNGWPESYHKFALGGVCTALAGVLLAKKILGFKEPVLRLYAWVLPIALAIQKIGCLYSGCCFGVPAEIPWAVSYSAGTIPYNAHMLSGMISYGSDTSLPVHPVQVYQIIVYLSITAVILILRNKLKNPRSVVYLSLALLFISRFFLEFLTDPAATVFGSHYYAGLKLLQWTCLILFILFLMLYLNMEYGRKIIPYEKRLNSSSGLSPVILMIFITFAFIILHNAFSVAELTAFNIRFLIISTLMVIFLFREISVPRYSLASVLLILLPLFLVSQTAPRADSEYEKNRKISFGSTLGHYYNQVKFNPGPGSCGGPSYEKVYYENKYLTAGAAYSITGRRGYRHFEYGGSFTGGFYSERELGTANTLSRPLIIASPFASYNWHWFGLGAEAKIGYVPYIPYKPYETITAPEDNHKITPIMPGFTVRLGPYNWLDAQLKFFSGFPEPLPTSIWDISLGTGFGMTDGSGIRIGTSFPQEENVYFRGHYLIDNRFGLTLRYKYGRNYFTDEGINNEVAIAFSYLLDK